MHCRRRRLAASLALVYAAATAGCGGDGLPVSPSPLDGSAALRQASVSASPSDYHEPPAPTPDPAPTPGPAVVTISIIGSVGTAAFAPNPLQASVGGTVVWTNNDATVHRIVLDDGTSVGTIAPGQSSAPIALSAPAVTYRCTFHPSMVGTIQDPAVVSPAPEPAPTPPDGGAPPDDDDDDDYGYYDVFGIGL